MPLFRANFGNLHAPSAQNTDTMSGDKHSGTTYVYGLTPGPQSLATLPGPWTAMFTPLTAQLTEAIAINDVSIVVAPAAGKSQPFNLSAGTYQVHFLTKDAAPFQPVLTRVDGHALDAPIAMFPVPKIWTCGGTPCGLDISGSGVLDISLKQGGQYVIQSASPRLWYFWFERTM